LPTIVAAGTVLQLKGVASAAEQMVQMLFVQSADGVKIDGGKMTLTGVSPSTIFFGSSGTGGRSHDDRGVRSFLKRGGRPS